jgi:predicted RecB family nuclease
MYKCDGSLIFSPSDLTLYLESPFASWMDRFSIDFPYDAPISDLIDEMTVMLQRKGLTHEQAVLDKLKTQNLKVIEIQRGNDALTNTKNAMLSGYDVIYQGSLENLPFRGYPDFLVKVPGDSNLGDYHYEVWEAKLSSTMKPSFAIQLCCYADMLEKIQGVLPISFHVILSNGEHASEKIQNVYYYYLQLKNRFIKTHQTFDPKLQPNPAESSSWGKWGSYANKTLVKSDHLSLIANITKSQIEKLNSHGIYTTQDLIKTNFENESVLSSSIMARLKAQASIQLESNGLDKPLHRPISMMPGHKLGLSLLPPSSPLDIFFDIEGFPLMEGGLEYLWGAAFFDEEGNRSFKDFWAHNRKEEEVTLSFNRLL